MKRNKRLFIGLLIFIGLVLTSCSSFTGYSGETTNKTIITQEITKNITTNIIEEVVDVKDITLSGVQELLNEAYERVYDAVLGVEIRVKQEYQSTPYEAVYGYASCVVYKRVENYNNEEQFVDNTYYVITNRHVVSHDENYEFVYYVYFGDDYTYLPLEVIGYDEKVDIACCKFNSTRHINPVTFGDSDSVKASDLSFCVGSPNGFDYYNTVTFGVVSSPKRYMSSDTDGDGVNDFYFEYIQHDTTINEGNSGGGLFNIKGELIGITSMKLVSSSIENMAFSIPSNIVKVLVEDYIEKGVKIERPRLGVTSVEVRNINAAVRIANNLQEVPDLDEYLNDSPYGLYVTAISEVSALNGSGIEVDDIILTIDGIKVRKLYEFSSKLNALVDYHIGDTLSVTYYDRTDGLVKTTNITLIGQAN